MEENGPRRKRLLSWLGVACLLAIIPVKALRFLAPGVPGTAIGLAPSLLGPAGLLCLLASATGKLARLTLAQATLITAAIAFGLEFAQLLPRPGLLARVHYTFDPLDLVASAIGILAAYAVARTVLGPRQG